MPSPPTNPIAAALVSAAAVVALLAVVRARAAVRGTTLVAAWGWLVAGLVAAVGVAVAEVYDPARGASALPALRYVAGLMLVAPTMALLGAKRPQHAAWQWIVLTLLVVLALPLVEAWAFAGRVDPALHTLRQGFLAVLVLTGLANHLATRFAGPAACLAAAQGWLLADQLPGLQYLAAFELRGVAAVVLLAAGLVAAWWLGRRDRSGPPLDRLWLGFRDAYGAVWTLRVAERVQMELGPAAARVRVGWWGIQVDVVERNESNPAAGGGAGVWRPLRACPEALAAADAARLRQAMTTLLRRFVDRAWIDARLAEPAAED